MTGLAPERYVPRVVSTDCTCGGQSGSAPCKTVNSVGNSGRWSVRASLDGEACWGRWARARDEGEAATERDDMLSNSRKKTPPAATDSTISRDWYMGTADATEPPPSVAASIHSWSGAAMPRPPSAMYAGGWRHGDAAPVPPGATDPGSNCAHCVVR